MTGHLNLNIDNPEANLPLFGCFAIFTEEEQQMVVIASEAKLLLIWLLYFRQFPHRLKPGGNENVILSSGLFDRF